jgi:hypothetical protein
LSEIDEVLDPHKYRCIRCKAPADIIFKRMLPYCFTHEPAESKAARQPKEGEMDESTKVIEKVTTDASVPVTITPTVPQTISVGGGWVVNAKDGTELHNGFASKKAASKWASLEVEHKRLKAGQYKIAKLS